MINPIRSQGLSPILGKREELLNMSQGLSPVLGKREELLNMSQRLFTSPWKERGIT